VEFTKLNFDFHPKAVRHWMQELGFKIGKTLTVSHFRIGILKRIVPISVLVFLDSLFQWTGALFQLTPSVFVRSRGDLRGRFGVAINIAPTNINDFFKCPECGSSPLVDNKDYFECPNCKREWAVKDGIYDFREPVES